MAGFDWDSSLETGNERVDAQHKALFGMLNEVVEALERGEGDAYVSNVLERLSEYVAVHFTEEQNLMEDAGLPADDLKNHTAEHLELTRRTREFILQWRARQVEAIELADFLAEWLTGHILDKDQALAQFMRES
jgi:hemerythrin